MGALLLFGLEWPLVTVENGFTVLPPTGLATGDSASIIGALSIGESSFGMALVGKAELELQGMRLGLAFNSLSLNPVGNDFRADDEIDHASVVLTMGAAPTGQKRARIGPSVLDEFVITGFERSGNGAGLLASNSDLLSGNPDAQRSPLSIQIDAGNTVAVDLGARRLILPVGAIKAVLSAHGSASKSGKYAVFTNDVTLAISFADIAGDKSLLLNLKRLSGAVPLNVPEKFEAVAGEFPPAPIEATECRAEFKLTPTGKLGALLTAAQLVAPDGGSISLAIQGIRNSRNRAERWVTDSPLGLAFRVGASKVWSTPLLAPSDYERPKLRRRDDLFESKVVPLHCWFGASQFRPEKAGASAEMLCNKDAAIGPSALIPSIAQNLQFRATRPWLRFADTGFHHSRPGENYQGKANTFLFKTSAGHCGGAPMLPRLAWEAGQDVAAGPAGAALQKANDAVNAAFANMLLQSKASVHETGLGDRTNGPGQPPSVPPAILAVVPDARVPVGSVELGKNVRRIDMASPRLGTRDIKDGKLQPLTAPGVLTLPMEVPNKSALEFAVLWPDQDGSVRPWVKLTEFEKWASEIQGAIDPAAPIAVADLIKDLSERPKGFPLAILKISRRLKLDEILADIQEALPQGAKMTFEAKRKALVNDNAGVIGATDKAVLEADWVGLIVFDAPIDFDAFPLLKAIVPIGRDSPRLSFFAVSPREAGNAKADIAISAAIDWKNTDTTTVVPTEQNQEATFKPVSLSVAFRDRRMIRFHAKAQLTFYSFFGVKSQNNQPRPPIDLIGSPRRLAGSGEDDGAFEIRFAAEVAGGEKLVLFPLNGEVAHAENTFLKTAWLKRVEVVDAPKDGGGRRAEIEMDGGIEFRKPDLVTGGEFSDFFKRLRTVDFSGLRIDLPDISGSAPRLLQLRYPSLRFNLDLPHIGLIGDALKLKFHRLALDWDTGFNAFDIGKFPRLALPGTGELRLDLPKILFIGRLDFGSLPDLFSRSLSGFSLEGLFGLNIDRGKFLPDFKPYVGIGGFGFDGLNFDLMSFIKLRIDKLRLGQAPWTNSLTGAALHIQGAWLDVVGVPVLKEGSGAFFSQDHDAGNGFWAAFRGCDFPLFKLDWGFVGQNIDFPPSIPRALLAPPPEKGSSGDFTDLSDTINKVWRDGQIVPAKGTAGKGWTFAGSIQALEGSFRGQVLFQDGGFAGLSLGGPALKDLLNWDFAFTGIYRKDITPGEDYFYFSVTLPAMTFGSVRFTGGTIAAEIYTSGDFMADIGFPWRASGGGRQWERTIGAIVTPGQASGGWYVRKRRTHIPDTNQSELTISGGVAFQWGLGAAFDGGVFKVWVRIGVYAIVEGSVSLRYSSSNAKIVAFMLQGSAGVLIEGEGKIDWWVISVRVGVRASAEIRAALIWDGRNGDTPVLMPIEAELSVSAYAEACIGGGCARICRSIRVGINIPVRYQLEFG
ncbi:MAG: hypothetical protein E6Q50_09235 [Lysobacter sp.]|nr:MAG: hypothetical protein E6Q50_09235 [Lysobacter sp.]